MHAMGIHLYATIYEFNYKIIIVNKIKIGSTKIIYERRIKLSIF